MRFLIQPGQRLETILVILAGIFPLWIREERPIVSLTGEYLRGVLDKVFGGQGSL